MIWQFEFYIIRIPEIIDGIANTAYNQIMPEQPKDKFGLTPARRRFLDAYLAGLKVPDAADVAGVAQKEGWKILRMPESRAFLDHHWQEKAADERLSRNETIAHLVEAILTPVGDIDETSPLAEVVEIRVGPDGEESQKVKAISKIECLKMLNRMLGREGKAQVEVSSDDSLVAMVAELTGSRKAE